MLAPPEKPIPLASEGHSPAAWVIGALLLVALGMVVLGFRGSVGEGVGAAARGDRTATSATRPVSPVVPPPPPVEPVAYADLTPDQARADNAARPFDGGKVAPAARFVFAGSAPDRVAARACLAAAVLYEAGDDKVGEQAVAQVVLNRLRHPAFPKTVCGVVFQGSERPTGCQFTFTCDGSLTRPPNPQAWERAAKIADAALSGFVVKAVGTATHYHADFVVPYWRASLTKLAEIHTHIFYRWQGWWGTPPAFTGRPQPLERIDPRIAALAGPGLAMLPPAGGVIPPDLVDFMPAQTAPSARVTLAIDGVPARALKGSIVRLKDEAAAQYVLQLDGSAFPGSWAVMGFTICGIKADCLVMGWTSESETPRDLPVLSPALRTVAFVYRKSSVLGTAKPAWDCRRFPRPMPAPCLPGTGPSKSPPPSRRPPPLSAALLKPPAETVVSATPPPAPASH